MCDLNRFDTLVPSSVAHRAMVDTKLGGYDIPKDTAVLASLYALHNAESVWKDPNNFRPERYLNSKGKLELKNDNSLPFGGKWKITIKNFMAVLRIVIKLNLGQSNQS